LHKGIQAVQRAVVHVCEVRLLCFEVVADEPGRPFCDGFPTARGANLLRSGDHDDRVEQRVRPGLVQKRDLDDGNARVDAVEPGCVALAHPRVEQLLEPLELGRIAEDDLSDPRTVRSAEALAESVPHVVVLGVEVVDDLIG